MKKQKTKRKYVLSDADLILKGKEKISFFRRDMDAFADFGITETMIAELESGLTAFSNSVNDSEAFNSQIGVAQAKKAKAEELRTAIRLLMKRVEFVYGVNTARYGQFGTKGLSRKGESDLLITGKIVVVVSTEHLQQLSETGLTTAMLDAILVLCEQLEELMHKLSDKIWERNYLQEYRIEVGNMLYVKLVQYASVGFRVWETTSAAKYNDYIIYNRARI